MVGKIANAVVVVSEFGAHFVPVGDNPVLFCLPNRDMFVTVENQVLAKLGPAEAGLLRCCVVGVSPVLVGKPIFWVVGGLAFGENNSRRNRHTSQDNQPHG
jgi:hypothetical protein